MKRPSVPAWWSELSGFQKTIGAALFFVGVGVWWGEFRNTEVHRDVHEVKAVLDTFRSGQAAFEKDEETFRKQVRDEVSANREARIRDHCRQDVLARTGNRALARRTCYGTDFREVPIEDLIADGYDFR